MIREWLRKWLGFYEQLDTVGKALNKERIARCKLADEVQALHRFVHQFTEVSADVSPTGRDASYAIVVGQVRGRDFVQITPVQGPEMERLVDELRSIRRLSPRDRFARFDGPSTIKAWVDSR